MKSDSLICFILGIECAASGSGLHFGVLESSLPALPTLAFGLGLLVLGAALLAAKKPQMLIKQAS